VKSCSTAVPWLVSSGRLNTAELLAHIAEIDGRKLYRPAGYKSMLAFCKSEWDLTRSEALVRIRVARLARDFPIIFEGIADGRLCITTVLMLKTHLNENTADKLLAAAFCKDTDEIDELLAEWFPKLDVPTQVVALTPTVELPPDISIALQVSPETLVKPTPAPKIAPLSTETFAVEFTMGRATRDKLTRVQELMSHVVKPGNIAEVFDAGLDELLKKWEKQKFAATNKPRRGRPARSPRTIPAEVRRRVNERDGGQCTYVSASGRRCDSRELLEYDHIEPVACGGESTAANVRLLCRAHNQLAAEEKLGAEFMETKRRAAAEARDAAKRTADSDVMPWLRALGIRPEDARRAAEHCASIPDAPLEERVRFALTFCGPRGARRVPAPTPITAPAMGSAA
jgi:5-methylcytosine-specific restriction endonuclease McrA